MNTADRRLNALMGRTVVKNRLQDLIMKDGWTELIKIRDEHLAKQEKVSVNKKMKDETRLRALEIIGAIKELFRDIESRIELGKSAEQTLSKEQGGE